MSRRWFTDRRALARDRRPRFLPNIERLENREVPTTFPAGFSETLIAGGMTNPTAMDFAPDGRLFVCQQGGQLRVIKNGSLLATPFVSISVNPNGERGLLGVAFDPNFAANGFVYVYYTTSSSPIHNRVSRFTADPGNPDVALAGSEVVLLDLDNLSGATNHNGGAIHFGADGKLYIATGENANPPNSQTLRNTHGKMLRINSDGTIPPDNPFANSSRAKKQIWATGFRNPYTFAVQPGTGRIYVNDVGSAGGGRREEVNNLFKKGNYGWPFNEGYTSDPSFVSPVFAYSSTFNGSNCAVTGGSFYNPTSSAYPASYVGKYFFQDLCGNWMAYIDPDAPDPASTVTTFATSITSGQPVDLKVGLDGKLYYLVRGGGGLVRRIDYAAASGATNGSDSDIAALVTANTRAAEAAAFVSTASATGATVLSSAPLARTAIASVADSTTATTHAVARPIPSEHTAWIDLLDEVFVDPMS